VIYDLFADRVVGRDTARLEVRLEPISTALYYTGAEALLRELPGYRKG
jgi:hypothetical protein